MQALNQLEPTNKRLPVTAIWRNWGYGFNLKFVLCM